LIDIALLSERNLTKSHRIPLSDTTCTPDQQQPAAARNSPAAPRKPAASDRHAAPLQPRKHSSLSVGSSRYSVGLLAIAPDRVDPPSTLPVWNGSAHAGVAPAGSRIVVGLQNCSRFAVLTFLPSAGSAPDS